MMSPAFFIASTRLEDGVFAHAGGSLQSGFRLRTACKRAEDHLGPDAPRRSFVWARCGPIHGVRFHFVGQEFKPLDLPSTCPAMALLHLLEEVTDTVAARHAERSSRGTHAVHHRGPDQRAAKADMALIVSHALPKGLQTFDQIDGVWVTEPRCAVAVAIALRESLIALAAARLAGEGSRPRWSWSINT